MADVFNIPLRQPGGEVFQIPDYNPNEWSEKINQGSQRSPVNFDENDPKTQSYADFLRNNPDVKELGSVESALKYAAYRGGRYLDNLHYGLYSVPSVILDFMGNSTEGINKLNDWLVDKTGIGTPSEETLMYAFQQWADETGYELHPDQRLAPDDIFGKVLTGLGQAPGVIASAAPFVALRGPALGFGLYEALNASPEGPAAAAIHGAKGAAFGAVLSRLPKGIKGVPGAMGAGAGMAVVDPETRNFEDITASALTMGVLHGSLSSLSSYKSRPYDRSKIPGIKSDYIDPIDVAKNLVKAHPDGSAAPKTPTTTFELGKAADVFASLQKDAQFLRSNLRKKYQTDPVTGERHFITDDTKALYRQQLAELRPKIKEAGERLSEYRLANKLEFSLMTNRNRAKELAAMRGTRPIDEFRRLTGHVPEGDIAATIKMQGINDAVETHPIIGLSHHSSVESLAKSMVRREGTKQTPVYKDVSSTLSVDKVKGYLLPAQFMADINPLIKHVVSLSHKRLANISYLKDFFLYRAKWTEDAQGKLAPEVTRRENSEKGALTTWKTRLDHKQKGRVADAIFEAQRKVDASPDTFRVTRKWLEEQGLQTRNEIQAFHSIRDNLELGIEYARHIGRTFGGPLQSVLGDIKSIPLYFPASFKGSFRVFVNNKLTGKNEITLGAMTEREAKTYKEQLSKGMDPTKYDINWERLKGKHTFDMPLQAFSEAIYRLGSESNEAKLLKDVVHDVLSKRGYRAHLTQRKARTKGGSGQNVELVKKNLKKRNEEFEDAIESYFEGLSKMVENTAFDVEIAKINTQFRPLKKYYNNSLEYINSYRSHVLGHRSKVTESVDRMFSKWLSDGAVDNAIRKFILTPTMIWKLHNPKFIVSQILQPYMVTPSRLYNLKAQGFKSNVGDAIIEAHMEFRNPSREAQDALRYAADVNAIIPSFALEITRKAEGFQRASSAGKKMWDRAIGRTLVESAEEYSRTMSFLMIYRYLRNSGVEAPKARQDAAWLTKKTMVDYAMHERPMIFGSSVLGTAGLPVGQFKTFQMNYFAQTFEHLATSVKQRDVRPIATWVASQVFMAGVYGTMLIEEADLLISMANKFFNLKLPSPGHFIMSNPEYFPDWVAKGLPSYWMGFDATTTLAAPGFSVGDLASLPGYDFAADMVSAAAQLMSPLNQTVDQKMKFWMRVAPSALQGLVEQYYTAQAAGAATGLKGFKDMFDMELIGKQPIPDWRKGGKGTVVRDQPVDWFLRHTGARPVHEARMMDDYFTTQRLLKDEGDFESALVNMWADLTMRYQDKPEWLKDGVYKHYAQGNPAKIAKFNQKVIARMSSLQSTIYERMLEAGMLDHPVAKSAKQHMLDEEARKRSQP